MTSSSTAPTSRSIAKQPKRIEVRKSGVHGRGVFATAPIAAGELIIEYVGEVITWKEALKRHPHDPKDPNHTFYFHIDEKHVIDAKIGGNVSRWINHACNPNCVADEIDGRIFINALVDIAAGQELHYDYGLVIEERLTPSLKAQYPCWCGAPNCRGTLLSPKRRRLSASEKIAKSTSRSKTSPKQGATSGHQAPLRSNLNVRVQASTKVTAKPRNQAS